MRDRDPPADWLVVGEPDRQSVTSDWMPVDTGTIDGVATKEILSIPTGSGGLTEIWRSDWGLDALPVDQVFQRAAQPDRIADDAHGKVLGDRNLHVERLAFGAGSKRLRDRIDQVA